MNNLQLFLPCAAGVEGFLAQEVESILEGMSPHVAKDVGAMSAAGPFPRREGPLGGQRPHAVGQRGGVSLRGSWREAMQINLHSRLAQRVLVQLYHGLYRNENDLYEATSQVAWEGWFTPRQSFKVELTAQHCPLTSLNFATLRIKDAVADRFRHKTQVRPDVNTQWPDVRVYGHLSTDQFTLYIDTSGEPLFKRGWRVDKGDAPLKETLAAAMLAASGWDARTPLYDPCCGSGTIAIEAAQMACGMAAGAQRRFAFEKQLPFQPHVWADLVAQARAAEHAPTAEIFGSDVAHRMVDFAQRNAERAGVAAAVQFRGGDALQRMPPAAAGVMLLNPPYGERIEVGGVAGPGAKGGARETAQTEEGTDFFAQLSTHWKKNYAGWTAWVLTPDLKLPSRMRLKESRRVPMWNGPIECRLFRFDMVAGSARNRAATPQ